MPPGGCRKQGTPNNTACVYALQNNIEAALPPLTLALRGSPRDGSPVSPGRAKPNAQAAALIHLARTFPDTRERLRKKTDDRAA